MEQPGLDGRHRDPNPPKAGEIRQKRGDTLNKNLPAPIPQFSPNAKLSTMRKETGKVSERDVKASSERPLNHGGWLPSHLLPYYLYSLIPSLQNPVKRCPIAFQPRIASDHSQARTQRGTLKSLNEGWELKQG
jgi:hypothetical protein